MRRIRGRGGFVALVDALGFLAVAAVVSVMLCASFSTIEPEAADWSDRVSETHRAFLACEVRLDLEGDSLPPMDVSTLAIMFSSGGSPAFEEGLTRIADAVLSELIPSSMSYEWTLSSGGDMRLLCGEDCSSSPILYSSTITLSSEYGLESRLVVWPSLGG